MTSSPSPATTQASSTAVAKRITRTTRLALEKKFAVVTAQIDRELESAEDVFIDCFYNADSRTSQLNKDDEYAHLLKLRSQQPFSLVKSIVLKDGEYEGHVALIMKPAFPFAFMKLNMEIRKRVYEYLFESEEKVIRIKTKTGGKKLPHALGYNAYNRAAILAVSSEVRLEALPVMYDQKFCFESTSILMHFLLQIGDGRIYLTDLNVESYVGSTARTSFYLLANCKRLRRIFFKHVSSNEQPKTAIKNFWNDAQPWLTAASAGQKDPTAVLKLLAFDRTAFHFRVKDPNSKGTSAVKGLDWSGVDFTPKSTPSVKKVVELQGSNADPV